MKNVTLAVLISLFLAIPAVATDGGGPPRGKPGQDFEQRKAEILKRIDERLARLQQERGCIQAARSTRMSGRAEEKYEPRDRPGPVRPRLLGTERPKAAPPRSESQLPETVTGTQGVKDRLDK